MSKNDEKMDEIKEIKLEIEPTIKHHYFYFITSIISDLQENEDFKELISLMEMKKNKFQLLDLFGCGLKQFAISLKEQIGSILYDLKNGATMPPSAKVREYVDSVKVLGMIPHSQKSTAILNLRQEIENLAGLKGPMQLFELELRTLVGFLMGCCEEKNQIAKDNLNRMNDLYNRICKQNDKDREKLLRWMKLSNEEFTKTLQKLQIKIAQASFLHFQACAMDAQMIDSGILAGKYLLQYNEIDGDSRFLFVAFAIDVSLACIKIHNFGQSLYMLQAASHVLDRFAKGKSHKLDAEKLASIKVDLKLTTCQHLMNLIIFSYNILKDKAENNFDASVREFESIQIPKGNELHCQILKKKSEASKIVAKLKNILKELEKMITNNDDQEWLMLTVKTKLTNMAPIIQAFPK